MNHCRSVSSGIRRLLPSAPCLLSTVFVLLTAHCTLSRRNPLPPLSAVRSWIRTAQLCLARKFSC